MNLWIGFSPWVIFWVLVSHYDIGAAAGATLFISLIVNTISLLRRRPKFLEIGSILFFLVLTITLSFINPPWLTLWIFTIQNAALLVIVLTSMIIENPFPLQYARDELPFEKRHSPMVIYASRAICQVWVTVLVILTIGSTARVIWESPIPWIFWATHMVFFFPTMQYTNRKLKRLKYS